MSDQEVVSAANAAVPSQPCSARNSCIAAPISCGSPDPLRVDRDDDLPREGLDFFALRWTLRSARAAMR